MEPLNARLDYETNICNHDNSIIPNSLSIVASFYRMNKDQRINTIRILLPAVTTRPDPRNTASNYKSNYMMRGVKICYNAFMAITQISKTASTFHSKDVSSRSEISR